MWHCRHQLIHKYPQDKDNYELITVRCHQLKILHPDVVTKWTVQNFRWNSEPIKRFPFGNSSDFSTHLRFDFRDSVSTSGLSGPLGGPLLLVALCSISVCVGNQWKTRENSRNFPHGLELLQTLPSLLFLRRYSVVSGEKIFLIKSSSAKISHRWIFSEGKRGTILHVRNLPPRDCHYYPEWALIQVDFSVTNFSVSKILWPYFLHCDKDQIFWGLLCGRVKELLWEPFQNSSEAALLSKYQTFSCEL